MFSLRTLSVLTIASLSLAACGGQGDGSSAAATPQFVATPSPAVSEPAEPSASVTASPSASPSKSASASPSPSKSTASTKATTVKYVFPVKASNVDWHETHSKYRATDIFADCGETVAATTSGVVLEISTKDEYVKGEPDGPTNGGKSVSLLGDDGVRYYGSHLSVVQSGIKAGVRVKAGQKLGEVGHTGNANNVCHLHFGISPACAKTGDWKVRRGVVWPYSYLESWRDGGQKSPVKAVAAWKKANDCKA